MADIMLDLQSILDQWKKESVIDDTKLDQVTVENARLHAKYLEILQVTKARLKQAAIDQKKLEFAKKQWYLGRMNKEEMDQRGWGYDPLGGYKVLKSEIDSYVEVDADVVSAKENIVRLEGTVEALLEIMENIKWKHQAVKNVLEWKKFVAGC